MTSQHVYENGHFWHQRDWFYVTVLPSQKLCKGYSSACGSWWSISGSESSSPLKAVPRTVHFPLLTICEEKNSETKGKEAKRQWKESIVNSNKITSPVRTVKNKENKEYSRNWDLCNELLVKPYAFSVHGAYSHPPKTLERCKEVA